MTKTRTWHRGPIARRPARYKQLRERLRKLKLYIRMSHQAARSGTIEAARVASLLRQAAADVTRRWRHDIPLRKHPWPPPTEPKESST